MPDIVLEPNVTTVNFFMLCNSPGPVWINTLTGYVFFWDTSEDLRYRKTTDGGVTWDASVLIRVITPVPNKLSVWYDRWTPGDTGTVIHFAVLDGTGTDRCWYSTLDTNGDGLGSIITVETPLNLFGGDWEDQTLSITKARGGNLYISLWTVAAGGTRLFKRSVDNGASWVNRDGGLFDGAALDGVQLYPGNYVDDQDIDAVYWDYSTNELSLKTYDDSGDSWSETLISASMNEVNNNVSQNQYAAAIRHSDGHLILAAWDDGAANAGSLLIWDINGAASITAKTNVITSETNHISVTLLIDQNNDDIYVAYAGDPAETYLSSMNIRYKISTNGGTSWGSAVRFNEDAPDFNVNVWGGQSAGSDGGRWSPIWFNRINRELLINTNTAIILPGGIPPSPNPPTPIVSQPIGGQAGTIIYITPDGREYNLITPHDPGRHVLSFQGLGTPPIEYVTQRGPFQDGETVRDFFLRPRTVQILERQNFCDRDAWWNGRSDILNELRPNRQTTPDGVTPGRLRFFRTDGTARDLRVFIATGPVFEPRVSNQWDEWSFQELLRFIAHDPILFSTTQTVSAFVIALDADLVFPITFPISFGAGLVDDTLNITYDGTWETFPIITIVGPIKLPRIDNNTTGEKLEFTLDIAVGQTVTIDLTEGVKTVVDQTGLNLIGGLTTDSDLGSFHIAPDPEATNGLNVIRLRGSEPTGATSVSLSFFVRYFGM